MEHRGDCNHEMSPCLRQPIRHARSNECRSAIVAFFFLFFIRFFFMAVPSIKGRGRKCPRGLWNPAVVKMVFRHWLLFLFVAKCRAGERELIEGLFNQYDPKVRPVKTNSTPVEVYVDYWFVSLLDVQEKGQILSSFGWMELIWVDEFLKWNYEENNISYIVVKAKDIWYPDIAIRNSAYSIYGEIFDSKKYKVPVYSNGTVFFSTAGQTKTICKLDLTYFPFDAQACYIHVDSWTYTVNQVVLKNKVGIRIELYKPNGQWTLINVRTNQSTEEFNDDIYSDIKFIFYLKRKPLYYMTNLIIPCCLMSAIVLFVFLLPASADEKVSLSITVLLSFSVFQLLVAGSMPETSDYVPLITVYITFVEFLASLSLLSTIIVLMLHHYNYHCPPPKWLRRLALEWMAVIFCKSQFFPCLSMNKKKSLNLTNFAVERGHHTVESLMIYNVTTNNNNNNINAVESPKIVVEEDSTDKHHVEESRLADHVTFNGVTSGNDMEHPFARSLSNLRREISSHLKYQADDDSDSSEISRVYGNLSSVYDLVKINLAKINLEKKRNEIKKQWVEISLVFDRFFLCVFLTITLVVGVLLLGIMPQFGPDMVEPQKVS